MNKIDLNVIEMTLDVMKYVIGRISATEHPIGKPKKEEELKKLVGETITPKGVGGEFAFNLWK
ncbi:MAG: aspartate aminotransferase family protein, partial [Gelidibacter sp.]